MFIICCVHSVCVCVFSPSAILYSTHKISGEQIGRNEKKKTIQMLYTISALPCTGLECASSHITYDQQKSKKKTFSPDVRSFILIICILRIVNIIKREKKKQQTIIWFYRFGFHFNEFECVCSCGCETRVCAWVFFWIFPICRTLTANCWRSWSLLHCDVFMCFPRSSPCLCSSLARSVLSVH